MTTFDKYFTYQPKLLCLFANTEEYNIGGYSEREASQTEKPHSIGGFFHCRDETKPSEARIKLDLALLANLLDGPAYLSYTRSIHFYIFL